MAFVGILSQIKLLFGPLVIQFVWYILKQFPSVGKYRNNSRHLARKYARIFVRVHNLFREGNFGELDCNNIV